jgi:hypothetical protein
MLAPPSGRAQTPTAPATRRPDPIQGELQRRYEAEAIEKILARRPQPTSAQERRVVLDQIKKDFLRIQVVDDELKQEKVRAAPDFGAVAKNVSEIKRCSERLRKNLSLPKVEVGSPLSPSGETTEYLWLRLADLSKSIEAFVTNPIFESAKIVNPNLSLQASHDLGQIISFSKEIKRLSKGLRDQR